MVPFWKIGQTYREHRLKALYQQLVAVPSSNFPDEGLLRRLKWWWANPGYSANLDYLTSVWRATAKVGGPILECGSGLTTLVAGAITAKTGAPLVVLEHHLPSYQRMVRVIDRLKLTHVQLHYCPLTAFDGFDWYDTHKHTLPEKVTLVICDGPTGSTRGGRYGLVPIMKHTFDGTCRILMDDTHRRKERETIRRWYKEPSLEIVEIFRQRTFAKLMVFRHPA
jgi:hypothetical protein